MALEFKLPDIGEGIAEGEIVKWLVKVGDTVKEHQAVVEVMTDKATVEIPAPAAGKISAIQTKEGQPVPVVAKISQETLAEMVGTTRSRVNYFMNKFRKLGLIEYNGNLKVHSSLLNVIVRE